MIILRTPVKYYEIDDSLFKWIRNTIKKQYYCLKAKMRD